LDVSDILLYVFEDSYIYPMYYGRYWYPPTYYGYGGSGWYGGYYPICYCGCHGGYGYR
jgi:hypothetical protein